MKVLVTGGTGFVGSHLCKRLSDAGHDVRVLLRQTSSRKNLESLQVKYQAVLGDLRTKENLQEAVSGVDVIFHVAACLSAVDLDVLMQSNVTGTRHLAQAAIEYNPGLKRFVYVSSLAAVGPAKTEEPQTEAATPAPISWYGKSKRYSEVELEKLKDKLPFIIVRPPAVYGPRDQGMREFFKVVNQGIDLRIGWFQRKPRLLSFVHVDDLVEGLFQLGMSRKNIASGEAFFICEDRTYTWEEAFALIAQGLQKRALTVYVPQLLLLVLAVVQTLLGRLLKREFPLTIDKYKELTARHWICSPAKAKELIGFEAKFSLQQGFRQTAEWYQAHSQL